MKHYLKFSAVAVAGALTLAACGGSSDDGSDAQTMDERTQEPAAATQPEAKPDLVETAVAAGEFTTLVKAVEAAGLVDTLEGEGPFTLFAPTDDAFAKLPPGTLDQLLADPAQLEQVLLYHVVAGQEVAAAEVVDLSSAPTAAGEPVSIAVTDGTVTLNGTSTVTQTDIAASNGVIHVIDAVLVPPAQ
jgi:uncharacterized surface protein with fasciclin (FAS1) repeats